MRVYLAGPMRGYRRFNFDAFMRAEVWLADHLKCEVVNPARIDLEEGWITEADLDAGVLPDGWDFEKVIARDLAEIVRCDAVAVLPGWAQSEGVAREIEKARALGLLIVAIRVDEAGVPREVERLWRPGDVWEEPARLPVVDEEPPAEVRVTNPVTGGQKGRKLARFDLLPWDALWEVAEHYGRGAAKYEDRNWERGYDWSLSLGALGRHYAQFAAGEDVDPETGSHHMAAVVFHALALIRFGKAHPELDDRP